MVRALASHQCDPGSIPGLSVICGLSLLLVLVLAPRGFPPGYSGFPLFSKTNTSKFQFDLDYCQALYHEPLAWEIAQALPVLLTLNKLHYFTIIHVNVTGYREEKNVSEIIETPFKNSSLFWEFWGKKYPEDNITLKIQRLKGNRSWFEHFLSSETTLTSSSTMFGFHSSCGHLAPIIPWETLTR